MTDLGSYLCTVISRTNPCMSCRSETVQHAMEVFARLCRMLLGSTAISGSKLEWGQHLVVLGVNVQPSWTGVRFTLDEAKAHKWLSQIEGAIERMHLSSGDAQKLAGRLTWSTQQLFYRVGRAMVKPIYGQKATATGQIGPSLLEALMWWCNVLRHSVSEMHPWKESSRAPCRMFVDAASTPARIAAVLLIDGDILYTDVAPCPQLMWQLQDRNDKQIMSLVRSLFAVSASSSGMVPVCCTGDHCDSICVINVHTAAEGTQARSVFRQRRLWRRRLPSSEVTRCACRLQEQKAQQEKDQPQRSTTTS